MTALNIIFVDDEDLVQSTVDNVAAEGHRAELYKPDEVRAEELLDADLVLLDLRIPQWTPTETGNALQEPRDGLGFASVVRSYFRQEQHVGAVALLSANLKDLSGGMLSWVSEPTIARLHNLEWAFTKDAHRHLPDRIGQLASASRAATDFWSGHEILPPEVLERYLKLPDTEWAQLARLQVAAAQPPIFELAAASRGMSVLRWLSQRILPFPTFLRDDTHVAVQLGVTPDSFAASLEGGDAGLSALLAEAAYEGQLETFCGRRWWDAGIQAVIQDLNEGQPAMTRAGVERLCELSDADLVAIELGSVVALSAELTALEDPVPRRSAVRIRPDDWPVFAAPAFVTKTLLVEGAEDAQIRRIRDLVDPADGPLIDP